MVTMPPVAIEFHDQLKAILVRLRAYAISLTRDRDRADDLVQETIVKALVGRSSFREGTNFSAWVFRIQRNEFISGLRRTRPTVPLDTAITDLLSQRPQQENRLVAREFLRAFVTLSPTQREALVLAFVDGLPYAVIADRAGVSVGTIKSRVSRARSTLERLLLGGEEVHDAPSDTVAQQAIALADSAHPGAARRDRKMATTPAGSARSPTSPRRPQLPGPQRCTEGKCHAGHRQ